LPFFSLLGSEIPTAPTVRSDPEEIHKHHRASPSPQAVPMPLNALASDSPGLASPARRESLRLLTTLCASHPDAATPHFHKALAHLARQLKDPTSDTSMHDVCRDAAGQLAAVYLPPLAASGVAETGNATVTLFMKPLFEVMGEQSKVVQGGAAVCLAKTVEGAVPGPGVIGMFGKLTACSFGLLATSQQYFSLRTNQPPAISQQYFSLRTNRHQPSATSQTNRLSILGFASCLVAKACKRRNWWAQGA
jgi:hypothetical protein